jgi:hypothetical protein
MSTPRRLQRLECRAVRNRATDDATTVEICLPDIGRGRPSSSRYPCEGSEGVMRIYEPTGTPPLGEAQPLRCPRGLKRLEVAARRGYRRAQALADNEDDDNLKNAMLALEK